jgi:hypothetical protein
VAQKCIDTQYIGKYIGAHPPRRRLGLISIELWANFPAQLN